MRLTPVSMPWARSPLQEPLTLAEAKAYLKIDHSDEDTLLTALIREARSWTESFTGRALIDQTWQMTLEAFPAVNKNLNPYADIMLPKGKAIAITGFTYVDSDGVMQNLRGMEVSPIGDDYQWDLGSEDGGIVRPPWDGSWPAHRLTLDAIKLTFRAGYTASSDIPQQIMAGLKWKLADLYTMRGDQDVGAKHNVAEALLAPWKLAWF